MKVIGVGFGWGILALATMGLVRPQSPTEVRWALAHDQVARYKVFDGQTGKMTREFWLLGCELDGRAGAVDSSDLPYRFLFRHPKKALGRGIEWTVEEYAFAAPTDAGLAPIQFRGTYRCLGIKKKRLAEVFKIAFGMEKGASEPVAMFIVEGRFQVFRCGRTQVGSPRVLEKRPSAQLVTVAAFRKTDGAIVGGRWQWSGRSETFSGAMTGTKVGRGTDVSELALVEPILKLTDAGLKTRIDIGMEKGVKWLKARQRDDGRISDVGYPVGTVHGVGATALCLEALLHSGVQRGDKIIRRGFEYLRRVRTKESYDLALMLMALEAQYLPMEMLEDIEKYSEAEARKQIAREITPGDKALASSAVKQLLLTQASNGLYGYANPSIPNVSNTQYAALGLKSASRMGVDVPASVWRRILSGMEQVSNPTSITVDLKVERWNGEREERNSRAVGWGYFKDEVPRGSMTCAALSTMAICESELRRLGEWKDKDSQRLDPLMWGALGWLQHFYRIRTASPEGCQFPAAMLFYYLYGLERAAVLYDVKMLGGHDWFREGASIILSLQQPDGHWVGPHGSPVVDTAWALLFLKRATIPVETVRRPWVATGRKKAGGK